MGMTPGALRATLQRLGLTQGRGAALLGVTDRTMRRWCAGQQDVPGPAVRLLALLEADPPSVIEFLRKFAAPQ